MISRSQVRTRSDGTLAWSQVSTVWESQASASAAVQGASSGTVAAIASSSRMAWPMATALIGSLPSSEVAVVAVGPAVAELGVEPPLVGRVGGDADPLGQGGDAVLGRPDPLAAVVDRGAVGRGQGQGPPADPVARLQHHHLGPGVHQPGRGGQAGQPGSDHDDVCCGGHCSLLARMASWGRRCQGCFGGRASHGPSRAPSGMRAECYEVRGGKIQRRVRFATISCRPARRPATFLVGKGDRMAITEVRNRRSPVRGPRVRTFDSTSPATGEVVGTFPVDGPEQVAAAVARAREAQRGWAELGFDGRRRALLAYKALLVRRTDELVALVHRENGKPHADALIEVADDRRAPRLGGPQRGHGCWGRAGSGAPWCWPTTPPRSSTSRSGWSGVIGPWNYPVFTPLGSIVYALAAGNAVVFKPSELTPAVGCFLADTFAEAVPGPPVFQVVTGDGATGHALCLAGVDKVALTGSPATGRKVMAACAERLTPVVLELGGKDAMVVDADADLDAAADQAVWGGMANAGQTCLAIERVYVVDAVYEPVPGPSWSSGPPGSAPAAAPTPTSAPSPCPGSSRSSSGTWTTPSPAGPGRWSAARTRSTRPMSTRWCWSTCPPTPWSCGRRPSARSCR